MYLEKHRNFLDFVRLARLLHTPICYQNSPPAPPSTKALGLAIPGAQKDKYPVISRAYSASAVRQMLWCKIQLCTIDYHDN